MTNKQIKQQIDRFDKIRALIGKIEDYLIKVEDALCAEREAEIAQAKPPLVVTKKTGKKK